jgi:hypothetical protein
MLRVLLAALRRRGGSATLAWAVVQANSVAEIRAFIREDLPRWSTASLRDKSLCVQCAGASSKA